jgi:hypothetical protein
MRARRARILLSAAAAAAVAIVCLAAWLAGTPWNRKVRFTVRDAASSSWVWDLTATLQGRVIRRFYQSDKGPVSMEFTRLRRGQGVLEVSAPSYLPMRIPVSVSRRLTVLEEPIEMAGYEIPDLADFLVFVKPGSDEYTAELRPIRAEGSAITNHPCLDLGVGCMAYVQTLGGAPVASPTDKGAGRGQLLFRDRIRWEWDGRPAALFRYHARIPRDKVLSTTAPYLVFDFLIVVPDPRRISSAETVSLMEKVWGTSDIKEAFDLLDADSSWNVERAP